MLILAVILTAEVFLARRAIGAVYGLCTTPWSLKIRHTRALCVDCHSRERECPMGCAPLTGEVLPSCSNCGACVDGGPEGVLELGFPSLRC